MNRIATALLILIFGCCCKQAFCQTTDPVVDYLSDQKSGQDFITIRDLPYFKNDKVFRYSVDLNRDGTNEILISSTLENDGKQGNLYRVYKKTETGFSMVGNVTLYTNGFYLGFISEINSFGIVKFSPAGGGEGSFLAYVFDGEKINEHSLGKIKLEANNNELNKLGLAVKYSRNVLSALDGVKKEINEKLNTAAHGKDNFVDDVAVIESKELSKKYNVEVESITHQEFLKRKYSKQ